MAAWLKEQALPEKKGGRARHFDDLAWEVPQRRFCPTVFGRGHLKDLHGF